MKIHIFQSKTIENLPKKMKFETSKPESQIWISEIMEAGIFWNPGFSGNLHLRTDETICIGIDQRGIQYLHKVRLFYNSMGYSTFAYGITASQSGGNLEKCSKTVDFDGFGVFRQH